MVYLFRKLNDGFPRNITGSLLAHYTNSVKRTTALTVRIHENTLNAVHRSNLIIESAALPPSHLPSLTIAMPYASKADKLANQAAVRGEAKAAKAAAKKKAEKQQAYRARKREAKMDSDDDDDGGLVPFAPEGAVAPPDGADDWVLQEILRSIAKSDADCYKESADAQKVRNETVEKVAADAEKVRNKEAADAQILRNMEAADAQKVRTETVAKVAEDAAQSRMKDAAETHKHSLACKRKLYEDYRKGRLHGPDHVEEEEKQEVEAEQQQEL